MNIDTGPLPPAQAAATRKLLAGMQAENPWILGYALSGSYGDPATLFPEADVDLNFLGEAGDIPTTLRDSHEWRLDGVDFHFSNRWYRARIAPDKLGLSQLVVAWRWHVLWEQNSAITEGQRRVAALLAQPAWREQRLAAELARLRETLQQRAQTESWAKVQAGELDFFWQTVFSFLCLLAPLDLRAASLARKGLLENVAICRAVGLPAAVELMLECVGARDITTGEMMAWGERATQACQLVQRTTDSNRRQDHMYYLTGTQEIIRRGEHQAAIFPLWRTLKTCQHLLGGTPAGRAVARDRAELAVRLGQVTDADFMGKVSRCRELQEYLESHFAQLLEHMSRRVAAERINE